MLALKQAENEDRQRSAETQNEEVFHLISSGSSLQTGFGCFLFGMIFKISNLVVFCNLAVKISIEGFIKTHKDKPFIGLYSATGCVSITNVMETHYICNVFSDILQTSKKTVFKLLHFH